MSIEEYFEKKGVIATEGHCGQVRQQQEDMSNLSKGKKRMMEIGFNGGNSADVFLRSNPDCELVSFDLGQHHYVSIGKSYIDETYPGRHTLILGDSRETIPLYSGEKFDFLFIDGGHDYHIAKADVENCKRLAKPDALVILDDTTINPGSCVSWNVGPNNVWRECIEKGQIKQLGTKEYCRGRGMSWGEYV
jgi:hypothetical protein